MDLKRARYMGLLGWGAALVAACAAPDAVGRGDTSESSGGTGLPAPTSGTSPTTGEMPGSTSTDPVTSTGQTDADTTETMSATDTGEPPGICGDGEIDAELGEQCDDGYNGNRQDKCCTLSCGRNVCGDGLVWAGVESCDNAGLNDDLKYGGCTTKCELGPRCGDGFIQAIEQCDYGSGNGTGETPPNGVPCTLGCRYSGKIAFVTSASYDGNLGGTAGARLKCQKAASDAGLTDAYEFRAWISSGPSFPAATFEYGSEAEDIPYIRPDGVRLALDFVDLINHGPGDGVVMTEKKELVLYRHVWTGTDPFGEPFNPVHDCEGWTSASPLAKGRIGRTGVDPVMVAEWQQWRDERQWTSYDLSNCGVQRRLYCFEQ